MFDKSFEKVTQTSAENALREIASYENTDALIIRGSVWIQEEGKWVQGPDRWICNIVQNEELDSWQRRSLEVARKFIENYSDKEAQFSFELLRVKKLLGPSEWEQDKNENLVYFRSLIEKCEKGEMKPVDAAYFITGVLLSYGHDLDEWAEEVFDLSGTMEARSDVTLDDRKYQELKQLITEGFPTSESSEQ